MRASLLVVLSALIAAACTPAAAPAPASPVRVEPSPSASAAAAPIPELEHLVAFVPIAHFAAPRDDVSLAELRDALVPESAREHVARLLPHTRLVPLPDATVLAVVRASRDVVAVVPPALVDASVKTLAVDGRFYWDRALDLRDYPLTLPVRGGAPQADRREALWEMVATGSVIFGRGVAERIARYGDPRRPFARVRDLTRAADLAVGALESPLSGNANGFCERCMEFVGNERYVAGLTDAGYDVLSLATNHSGDAGARGVLDTVRVLDAAGIAHAGAGADLAAARRAATLTVRGLRVAFLAYTDVPPEDYGAAETRPGNARLDHRDYASVAADIRAARAGADLVVVLAHWGVEYEDRPRPWVVAAARAMVDAGADLVIGDHPHWVQSVELYHGRYIAYSTGNFVFDQMWSPETRQGAIHRLFFAGTRLVSVRVLPVLLEDWHQPRLLAPDEPAYRATLERMWRHSSFGE